jgi:uncharacterized DUF497 family protein
MRLVDDRGAASWLDQLAGSRDDFEWDSGNRVKNRKHGVEAEDVESMFHFPIVFAGRIAEPACDEPRWLLLGRSGDGRHLALIFTRRGNRVRPISCRPMRRGERKIYEEAVG